MAMGDAKENKEVHGMNEVIDWKRNVNIEQKELKFLARAEAEMKERAAKWELERVERENATAAAREKKKQAFQKEYSTRKHQEAELDYKSKMRTLNIHKKEEKWKKSEAKRAVQISEKAKFEERETARILSEVKERKNDKLAKEADDRAARKAELKALDEQREKAIAAREKARRERELKRVQKIQEDFEKELDAACQEPNETGVPMKSLLVKAVHAPAVDELHFALADLRETVDDLLETDMERRAKSQGIRVFHLVRQMEDRAKDEWERIHKTVGL